MERIKPIFSKEITVGNILSLMSGVIAVVALFINFRIQFERLAAKVDNHEVSMVKILASQEEANRTLLEFKYYLKYHGGTNSIF